MKKSLPNAWKHLLNKKYELNTIKNPIKTRRINENRRIVTYEELTYVNINEYEYENEEEKIYKYSYSIKESIEKNSDDHKKSKIHLIDDIVSIEFIEKDVFLNNTSELEYCIIKKYQNGKIVECTEKGEYHRFLH